MKRTTLFSSLLTAAFGIVTAGPANADTFTWVGTAGANGDDWRVPANWDVGTGYPGSGDTAIIPGVATNDPVIDQQNEEIASLTIQHDGVLTVSGKTLDITGSGGLDIDNSDDMEPSSVAGKLVINAANGKVILSGGGTHDIDGIIEMDANGVLDVQAGTLDMNSANSHPIGGAIWLSHVDGSTLRVSAATTFDLNGDDKGSVIGQDADAKIDIADATFTSNIIVQGMMTVREESGTATFVNGSTGVVRANDSGILSFASGLTISDGTACSPSWEAIVFGATLEFNDAATNLNGTFVLDNCATMKFEANITTVGKLVDSSASSPQGFIDVNSTTFAFRTVCNGGSPVSYSSDQTLGSCPP